MTALVDRYLELGLRVGRHIDGFVDAYYGPEELSQRVEAEAVQDPASLAADGSKLLADVESSDEFAPQRQRWLLGQIRGVATTARRLAGESISYLDEVEACYGVRPELVPEDDFAAAHRLLDEALPGTGDLTERYMDWRDAHIVPAEKLEPLIHSLTDECRQRTHKLYGLPHGEQIEWTFETNKPWSGFNYYLGDMRSRVAINVDLPVYSLHLAHLVAHETYPGHHTERTRKEVGLVRRQGYWEESLMPVGTPQCLVSEGLAELAPEMALTEEPELIVAEHMRPLEIPYDVDTIGPVRDATRDSRMVRSNAAIMLHEHGVPEDEVLAYIERWELVPRDRAAKIVSFLTDANWRAYSHSYTEGLRLCRQFIAGKRRRFQHLVTDQLGPEDLAMGDAQVAE